MAQEPNRTSARYDPNCDGTFFIQKDRSEIFQQAVVTVFESSDFWQTLTVTRVIDSPLMLMRFADEVKRYLSTVCRPHFDLTALKVLDSLGSVDEVRHDGFSFCNHVAKRLLRARKAGKLRPRGTFKGPTKFAKSPDAVKRSTGGTIIQGLE